MREEVLEGGKRLAQRQTTMARRNPSELPRRYPAPSWSIPQDLFASIDEKSHLALALSKSLDRTLSVLLLKPCEADEGRRAAATRKLVYQGAIAPGEGKSVAILRPMWFMYEARASGDSTICYQVIYEVIRGRITSVLEMVTYRQVPVCKGRQYGKNERLA